MADPGPGLLHLDAASAGRSSPAVVEAVTEHLRAEVRLGAYDAAALAAPAVAAAREAAARLLGTDAAGVAFTESATASLVALLDAWPLPPGARVGVPPASWGPNLLLLEHRGLRPVLLPADDRGVVDLVALARVLRDDPPDLLLLDLVASHRGLLQPTGAVTTLAREHGVPVWVDAAQALGHVDCTGAADAVVATSRKWLAGPRGVWLLSVAPAWRDQLRPWRHPGDADDAPPVAALESREAFVAGRLGLGVALAEHESAGPAAVQARLVEMGEQVRAAVADVDGWSVVRPDAPAASITAVAPTRGQDVGVARERLLREHGILTAVCLPWRAPHDPALLPSLRVAARSGPDDADLDRLVRGLGSLVG